MKKGNGAVGPPGNSFHYIQQLHHRGLRRRSNGQRSELENVTELKKITQ
jgi:hypothetical protein